MSKEWFKKLVVLGTIILFIIGCGGDEKGKLCKNNSDCDQGYVCVSQVLNCDTNDPQAQCWGTCEVPCIETSECSGDEICVYVNGNYICRSKEYEGP